MLLHALGFSADYPKVNPGYASVSLGGPCRRVVWWFLITWLAAGSSFAQQAPSQFPKNDPLPPEYLREKERLARDNPKVDSRLWEFSRGDGNRVGMRSKGVSISSDDQAYVTIRAVDDAHVEELRQAVEKAGGAIDTVSGSIIFAKIPKSAVSRLGSLSSLQSMAPQAALRAHATTAGVSLPQLRDLLHVSSVGLGGKGITIAVLDGGFAGLDSLVAEGVIRKPLDSQWFYRDPKCKGIAGCPAGNRHGTEVLRLIGALAPQADLVVAAFDGSDRDGGDGSSGMFTKAVQWLVSPKEGGRRASIINYSGGTHEGRHDGNDVLDAVLATEVFSKGISWVGAAGNEGDKHVLLERAFSPQKNAELDVPGSPDGIVIKPTASLLSVIATWTPLANLNSPDPQDIDWILYRVDKSGRDYVRSKGLPLPIMYSHDPQFGTQLPVEAKLDIQVMPGQTYVMKLIAARLTSPVRLHVFFPGFQGQISPQSAAGSLAIPATNPSVISVAAVNPLTGEVEPYSSRGPSDADPREIKPTMSAYDRVQGLDGSPFMGTSAAAAIATGNLALLKSACPGEGGAKVSNLAETLRRAIRPLPGSPNSAVGYGIADVARIPGACDSTTARRSTADPALSEAHLRALLKLYHSLDPAWEAIIATGRQGLPLVYHDGERMIIAMRSARAGYYILLNQDGLGKIQRIAPTGNAPIRLEASKPVTITPENTEALRVDGPPGRSKLILVVSEIPIDDLLSAKDINQYRARFTVGELEYWVGLDQR